MKFSQWTAVLFLAAVVFVVTFAWNYVATGGKKGKSKPLDDGDALQLNFVERYFPPSGSLDQEMLTSGSHDFLFFNDNIQQQPVTVGLNWKNCKCAKVDLRVLSADEGVEWQKRRRAVVAVQVLAGGLGIPALPGTQFLLVAPALVTQQTAIEQKLGLPELEAQAQETTLIENMEGTVVPAGAVGWVRLGWSAERREAATQLKAKIWMSKRGTITELVTLLQFHEPLRIKQIDKAPGEVRISLGQSSIRCWSSTRPSLRVQAKLIGASKDPANDPLLIGAPEQLTLSECQELQRELTSPADQGRVMCGYRIPIVLRERGPAGKTRMDLGPFHRQLELSLVGDEEKDAPQRIDLRGRVLGDVTVSDVYGSWVIRFNEFDRARGAGTKSVNVRSDTPGLKLEIDKTRTASFLDAHLIDVAASTASWRLEARVPPNRVSGKFPRPDDPEYQDSAIYLRTLEDSPRFIRIPVEGTAKQ